ncbi:hypothetical protein TNCV_4947551 [Trichonephila clavipes]|nr:hypothetical protein TNCV_4947551 [Trichonephila clavipes]
MTKSVVSVDTIVGYNRYHTPRHRIKEALVVSLRYYNPYRASTYFHKVDLLFMSTIHRTIGGSSVVSSQAKKKWTPYGHSTLLQTASNDAVFTY